MESEFHQLTEKIKKLVTLIQLLRIENTDLRLSVSVLTTENTMLSKRIHQAYQSITALLEKLSAKTTMISTTQEEKTP